MTRPTARLKLVVAGQGEGAMAIWGRVWSWVAGLATRGDLGRPVGELNEGEWGAVFNGGWRGMKMEWLGSGDVQCRSPVEGINHQSELFENGCVDRPWKGLIINPNCLKMDI
ncbi:unnamed protein product [Sphenostylis stenocarpa]|uniref:Uncharacterized protein n=1 Tax=Sphenostylis stenocarpa TaxID=92480 RepID=A0AA86STU0_9FABA|nr:unnamed protein product [Sphenostylis stenocarpa]